MAPRKQVPISKGDATVRSCPSWDLASEPKPEMPRSSRASRETGEEASFRHEASDDFESALNSALETLRCTMMSEHMRALDLQSAPGVVAVDSGAQSALSRDGDFKKVPTQNDAQSDVSRAETAKLVLALASDEDDAGEEVFSADGGEENVPEPDGDPVGRAESWKTTGSDDIPMGRAGNSPRANRLHDIGRVKASNVEASKLTQTQASAKMRNAEQRGRYELFVGMLIILNAVWLGVEVQLVKDGASRWARITVSAMFCAGFLLDVVVRLYAEGRGFFKGKDFGWNTFDVVVVVAMIIELLGELVRGHDGFARYFAGIRIIRLTRVLRFARVVQALDKYQEFSILLTCIKQCMPTLAGAIFVSGFFIYVFAIGFYDGADHCDGEEESTEFCHYFGTMGRSYASMYLAMYDGIAWGDLIEAAGPLGRTHQAMVIAQVSFLKIVIANAIIGVIVSASIRVSRTHARTASLIDDKEQQREDLIELFVRMDLNQSGALSLDELELAVEDPRVELQLANLKINVTDVCSLFALLDENHAGSVDIGEFVSGMQALRGDARALDVAIVQRQCSEILQHIQEGGRKPGKVKDSARSILPGSDGWQSSAASGFLSHRSQPFAEQASIEESELRAMSLFELHQVRALVSDLCVREAWSDPYTGKALTPAQVNLYHLAHHYILPKTAPGGVILDIPDCACAPGAEVLQFDAAGRCTAEGVVVLMTESGPKVQLRKGAFFLGRARLRIGETDVERPTNIDAPTSISYKELVSSTPTRPVWFCSHWWGESVLDFISCCEEHARLRGMDRSSATYWICAYANRQHSLESDIGGALERTSFHKAMTVSQGILLHLDPHATALTRIWCDFEIFCAVNDRMHLDIITMYHGAPQLLCNCHLPNECARDRISREARFPITLLVAGMHARLQDGEATDAHDKGTILHYISEHGPCADDEEENLRCVNSALNSIFARSAWPQAVKRGMVLDFDKNGRGVLQLPDVLRQDTHLRSLHISLEHMDAVTDAEVANVASALPPNLFELKLSFEGCQRVSSAGVAALAERLPMQLQVLKLDFLGCIHVDDRGLQTLALHLPAQLQEIGFHFDRCRNITEAGVRYLAARIPRNVKVFRGTFRGTAVDRNFYSLREMHAFEGTGNLLSRVHLF